MMRRGVAQQPAGFSYVSPAIAHIINVTMAIHGLALSHVRVDSPQGTVKLCVKLIERGLLPYGHVVYLIDCPGIVNCGGQQIGLNHVFDVTEIATSVSVAIY